MSLPVRHEVQALVRIHPVSDRFAHSFVPGPGYGWYARFYQAEPAPVVGTTKCPESLCPMLALPSSGSRVADSSEDITPRSLLLRTHSPILCGSPQLRLLASYEGVCAGCDQPLLPPGSSRRYFCESVLRCLSPYPGGPTECICLVLPQRHRPSPKGDWVGFPLVSANTIFRGGVSRLQLFRYVQASQFACLPDRSYRCKSPHRAAETFTSEQNVRRYLRTHRICYPPDHRQLAERGLAPRKIRSFVGCSHPCLPFC